MINRNVNNDMNHTMTVRIVVMMMMTMISC